MAGTGQTVHWTEKLQKFDRRWVFLAMAIAILAPFVKPCNLPYKASPMVKSLYYTIEELPEDSVVFVSLDFDPASTPELQPFLEAALLHLKRKNIKLVFATTWYAAPPLIERYLDQLVEKPIYDQGDYGYEGAPDRAYVANEDYVWLGFREGREAVISAMGNDLWATFDGKANDGTSLSQIPMMEGRKQLKDFDLVILISAGYPGVKEYVQQVQARYKLKMVGSCTAVSTTEYTPYYQAGQLLGLAGGMSGSADYEKLVGRKANAAQGNDVLNAGYGVVIVAIIFGNFIYFAGRRQRRRYRRGGSA
jgi:hypothetical protein